MQDARLERLFERYRRHGDVPALGKVFDATAGELLCVAMGLVREPGEADDLLQETFLTAIERAGRYESGRRLVPWLLGILVHHARERRRLARRGLDATRLERPEPERPEQRLLGLELEEELERALGELSARERAVLEAYLKHGKGAAEIAHELGSSPGAVRMQIHRGLDRLRKVLPAGLALGAAGSALSAQGLDGVRATVLRAGEVAAGSLVPGAGSTLGGLGSKLHSAGVIVGKKGLLAAVGLALCALFFTWRGLAEGSGFAQVSVAPPAASAERAALETGTAPLPEVAAAARGERVPLEERAAPATSVDPLVGGLRGRLVERDGRPLAGKSVALLELTESALFADGLAGGAAARPPFFVASATSGTDGAFALTGAQTQGAFHGLGIDLGGSRPSVRVVDVALVPGELVELGDIVLVPTGVLRGRVVDERGQPVAGARVRAGRLTEFVRQFGLHELATGGALGELRSRESRGEPEELASDGLVVRLLLEVPDWLGRIEEYLPFVTARTDATGEFRFGEAPSGELSLLLDRPGRMTVAAAQVTLAAGGELDLGPLELDAGRTLAGRVLDSAGTPVAGAEVRGGRLAVDRGPALFAPAQRTDAEGRFRLTGLSSASAGVVIARRDASSSWTPLLGEGEALELRLAPEHELVVEVVDVDGAPIENVTFALRPGGEASALGLFVHGLPRVPARAAGPGRWNLGPRSPGDYVLVVRAPRHVRSVQSLAVQEAGLAPLRIVLERTRSREVFVLDAASGAPLRAARVTVARVGLRQGLVASGVTDAQGRVELELPQLPPDEARTLSVRAEHPLYGPRSTLLAAAGAPTTLALGPGGTVIARADPGQLGGTRFMLVLEQRGAPPGMEQRFPRLSTFDDEGVARSARLPAGTWSWSALESLSPHEALSWLGKETAPRELASGHFELAEGQTLELAVGVPSPEPVPGQGSAVVHGQVRIDGLLPRGAEVYLHRFTAGGHHEPLQAELDTGSFRFEGVEAGGYFLVVATSSEHGFSQLGTERVTLAEGEVREFTLEYHTLALQVRVSDGQGHGVEAATVSLWPTDSDSSGQGGGSGLTDRSGRARIALTRAGRFRATAQHEERGSVMREFEVAPDGSTTLELVLDPGVPCSGRARFAPGSKVPSGPVTLLVRPLDVHVVLAHTRLEFTEGEAPFSLVGLPAGRYVVEALYDDARQPELSIELPEWGATTLELVLGVPPPETARPR